VVLIGTTNSWDKKEVKEVKEGRFAFPQRRQNEMECRNHNTNNRERKVADKKKGIDADRSFGGETTKIPTASCA